MATTLPFVFPSTFGDAVSGAGTRTVTTTITGAGLKGVGRTGTRTVTATITGAGLILAGVAKAAKPQTVYPREWTIWDPNLRIDEYSNETMHTAVVTYLPTGLQEACGRYPHQIQNRTAAIAKLRSRVGGT